jgi:hypothetical protein
MKKLVFFMAFLVFTRIGMSLGFSAAPVGIGNFFIGAPAITESNLNQVLGLLVGPSGQPGVAGISGANGINGINGLPGIPGSTGAPGVPGIQGIQGVPGTPGTPGAPGAPGKDGGIGSVGIGGGKVLLDACDKEVNISAAQEFTGSSFELTTVTVNSIDITSCAGQQITIYISTVDADQKIKNTYECTDNATVESLKFTLGRGNCTTIPRIQMSDLGDNIGLEFTEIGAGA